MMNEQSSPANQERQQVTDMAAVLKKYVYHWPLFLLGVVIAGACASAYLTIVKPKYEISATILVKDGKKTTEEKSALKELDQADAPNNAETEIQVLRSKNIVSKVVNDLQLWVSYTTGTGLNTIDLYGRQPFTFSLLSPGQSLNGQKISILVKDKNTLLIQAPGSGKITAAFGKVMSSSFGKWTVKPSTSLDRFIGKTVYITLNDPEAVSNAWIKTLDAHLLDKLAPTIGLFITDEIPARGKNFLNRLISSYNGATSDEEKRTTKSTIDFIDNRLTSLKSELNDAEKQVEGFRTSEGLTDIGSQSKVYLENVQTNDGKLNEVNVQLNVAEGIERYVNAASGTASPPATAGISDPALNEAVENLSQLQLKKAALLATTPESNPMFEPLNRQINTARAAIKGNIQGIKSSLLTTKHELQSFNNTFESSIRDIPGQERQYVGMKRQQAIKENLYVYLLQKREELALSYASTLVDARIVDKANVGDIKWPKKQLIWAIACFCGLGIPFLIIYFRRAFNTKITSRKEVELALNIPVLGEVSLQKSAGLQEPSPVVNEQFRTLRTHLLFLLERGNDAVRVNELSVKDSRPVSQGAPMVFIIDGIQQNAEAFKVLNPQEIKDICLLKDPSHIDLYGARAINGVVKITTNRHRLRLMEDGYENYAKFHNRAGSSHEPDLSLVTDKQAYQVSPSPSQAVINHANHLKELVRADAFSGETGKIIVCTSSVSGEGTSFICTQLALSLAATGKKTVVVDLNLHKPTMGKVFSLSRDYPGATDFLSAKTSLDEVIQSAGSISGPDVICSGEITAGSSELLENERFALLIDELKQRYAYVLIDSPPAHLVTDALIIARMADVSLYTIRRDYTERAELDFIDELFQSGKLPAMNLVYNGLTLQKIRQSGRKDAGYRDSQGTSPGMSWKQFINRF